MSLLKVENLKKHYAIKNAKGEFQFVLKALDDVSFELPENIMAGVVGESGCGKSTLGKAILLLETPTEGTIEVSGNKLLDLTPEELRVARKNMQMIFQDPYSSLNRRKKIQDTLELPLRIHQPHLTAEEREAKIESILQEVGLDPKYKDRYPHQFSGGQRQRIAIARAIINDPKFLVADESVSALDVSVQAQILNLLNDLKAKHGFTCLFISHDLKVIEYISDFIIVMYMGKIVEMAPKASLHKLKYHPYTETLFNSHPSMDLKDRDKEKLPLGEPPNYKDLPKGCAFYNRCSRATDKCFTDKPPFVDVAPNHKAACWVPKK